MELSKLSPDEGIELAVKILLEKGFKSDSYYSSFKAYIAGEEEIEDDYPLTGYSLTWEAILEYVARGVPVVSDEGITATLLADQGDGPAHSSSEYFLVMSLSDGNITRYFKREGWYASYDGGHLEDGENVEVYPITKTVTAWKEKK
jgi:hypothetical protein